MIQRIQVIDSHTGGEPTRIIIGGGPELGSGPLSDRLVRFREEFDGIRSATVNEPRGSEVLVGGLLCEPFDPACSFGVIFFNVAGFLGMCGHGTIGLMKTLRHMGRIEPGVHKIETPVGLISAELFEDGTVAVQNVPSYRLTAGVEVDVPDYGRVIGDVAWGGNWFFLARKLPVAEKLVVENWRHLTQVSLAIRDALASSGITAGGAYIDHLELFGPPEDSNNHSRNFVLCPGGAYDRSPCGTGMSAKMACLAGDGKLAAGDLWRQESIIGSVFECSYEAGEVAGEIVPTIRGTAHISGEATLLLDPSDPFAMGIRP